MGEKAQNTAVSEKNTKAGKVEKKPNAFVRFGRWIKKKFKDMWLELKKVSWPKFSKVVKQTGIVLGVVAVFLVFITAIDFGLEKLLALLTRVK